MNTPVISIVIPVYNVSKYLSGCIESVLNQEFQDFELILVDDGSVDDSGKICDEYAEKDNRILVIHQKNGGVSSARNVGIKYSKGKWITFIDSDDVIMSKYLSNLIMVANKYNDVDFVVAGYQTRNREFGNVLSISNWNEFFTTDAIKAFFTHPNLYSNYLFFPFSKLYKKDIIKQNNLLFEKKMSLGEDRVFIVQYLKQVQNVVFSPYYDYNIMYDNKRKSLSTKQRSPHDYFNNFQFGYKALQTSYQQHTIEPLKKYIDNFIIDRIFKYIIIPFSKFNAEKNVSIYIYDVVIPFVCSINIQPCNIRNNKIKLLYFLLKYINIDLVVFICNVRNFFMYK